MELKDILTLMDRLDASGLTGLTLTEGECTLKLEKTAVGMTAVSIPAAAPAPQTATPAAPLVDTSAPLDFIKAPLVGTFYAAPSPDQAPFVSVGDTVKKGKTVCVLEAMKMMSEVAAPADCVIEEALIADGELAGFDAPLFRVRFL